MPKPIISWPGGKRRLLKHLYPHFPIHDCYVEAFAGGAASLLMRPYPAQMEVLNDINGELVSLYRCVRHHLDEFVRMFRWSLVSRQMFEWAQMERPETLTDIQRAARFYYLQKLALGGKVQGQSFGVVTAGGPRLNPPAHRGRAKRGASEMREPQGVQRFCTRPLQMYRYALVGCRFGPEAGLDSIRRSAV